MIRILFSAFLAGIVASVLVDVMRSHALNVTSPVYAPVTSYVVARDGTRVGFSMSVRKLANCRIFASDPVVIEVPRRFGGRPRRYAFFKDRGTRVGTKTVGGAGDVIPMVDRYFDLDPRAGPASVFYLSATCQRDDGIFVSPRLGPFAIPADGGVHREGSVHVH